MASLAGKKYSLTGHTLVCLSVLLLLLSGCTELASRREIQRGNEAYNDGDYGLAVKLFEQALKAQPQLAIGWFNLGCAYLGLFSPGMVSAKNEKMARGAIHAFNEYLKTHPDDVTARDYLLSTYLDSGHPEGAIAYFQKKLDKNPTDVEAMAQIAKVSVQAALYDDAVRWQLKRMEIEKTPQAKVEALQAIGVMNWGRLHKQETIVSDERGKIADQGLAALQKALTYGKDNNTSYVYANLIYRERSLAHRNSMAAAIDMASAEHYRKKAVELQKIAAAKAKAEQDKNHLEPKK